MLADMDPLMASDAISLNSVFRLTIHAVIQALYNVKIIQLGPLTRVSIADLLTYYYNRQWCVSLETTCAGVIKSKLELLVKCVVNMDTNRAI